MKDNNNVYLFMTFMSSLSKENDMTKSLTVEEIKTWIKVIKKLDEVNENMELLKEEMREEQANWDAFKERKRRDDEERRIARAARTTAHIESLRNK